MYENHSYSEALDDKMGTIAECQVACPTFTNLQGETLVYFPKASILSWMVSSVKYISYNWRWSNSNDNRSKSSAVEEFWADELDDDVTGSWAALGTEESRRSKFNTALQAGGDAEEEEEARATSSSHETFSTQTPLSKI